MSDLPMKPLQASYAATKLERELYDLFIRLFDEHLRERSDEINVYGAPHLGPMSLIERHVASDGLALLRDDEDKMRFLFKAWRHRNPERGLHFLRTYLRVLFGDGQDVAQMWQEKALDYPESLKSREEIIYNGESLEDYFLTSRVRVDLDTTLVPDVILRALRTSVAARFLLNIRIAKFGLSTAALASICGGSVLLHGSGSGLVRESIQNTMRIAQVYGGALTFHGTGTGVLSTVDPPPPPLGCSFPLNADETEVLAAGADQRLTMSGGDQTFSHTIVAEAGSTVQAGAFPAGSTLGTGQRIDTTVGAGIVAIGVALDNLPSEVASTVGAGVFLTTYSASFGNVQTAMIVPQADGTTLVTVFGSGVSSIDTSLPSAPSMVKLYFNSNTMQWGYTIDGADGGYVGSYSGGTDRVPFVAVIVPDGTDAAYDGQIVQGRFLTDAEDLGTGLPSGATDPCGDTI